MPTAPGVACSVARCPDTAVARGRCERHQRTTTERGYGAAHQRERRAALPGARCEGCGCSSNLQRDHVDPTLTGPAREAPRNKRWLCRCPEHLCHDRLGVKTGSHQIRKTWRREHLRAGGIWGDPMRPSRPRPPLGGLDG